MRRLQPDLILTQQLCDVCAVGYGSVARLAATLPGPPRVVKLEPFCLADVFTNIRTVAALTGMPARGEAVVATLAERVEAYSDRSYRDECTNLVIIC